MRWVWNSSVIPNVGNTRSQPESAISSVGYPTLSTLRSKLPLALAIPVPACGPGAQPATCREADGSCEEPSSAAAWVRVWGRQPLAFQLANTITMKDAQPLRAIAL